MATPGKFLTFTLHQETFGIPIGMVREIIGMVPITSVPNTPFFVKGVINLRGKILPVMNLRLKFGLEEVESNRETCIVIIDVNEVEIGVVVDTVQDVCEFTSEQLEDSPNFGGANPSDQDTGCIIGMGKKSDKVVILVDLSMALSGEHLSRIMQINSDQVA